MQDSKKEETIDILKKLEKSKRSQKLKKFFVVPIISVLLIIIIFLLFSFYQYYKTPEKTLGIGANIESALLSEDGRLSYLKLAGGSLNKNITKIKFVFKSGKNNYGYETDEGIQEISIPLKKGFIDWILGKQFEGNYDYQINAQDLGLENFKNIEEVSVVFEYKTESGDAIDSPSLDTTKTTPSPGGGGSNGGGSSSSPSTCTPNCENKNCGDDGCGGSCGQCEEEKTCQEGICILQCINDTQCSEDNWYNVSQIINSSCTIINQTKQENRDYYCNLTLSTCDYNLINETEWINISEENQLDNTICDDSLFCTISDVCLGGLCYGEPKICEDDNLTCSVPYCNETTDSCKFDISSCSCILDEDCPDDGNKCTDEICSLGECTIEYNLNSCNDNDLCTENDQCLNGICEGSLINCDDSITCTVDSCSSLIGCENIPDDELCESYEYCSITGCLEKTCNSCSDCELFWGINCNYNKCKNDCPDCYYDPMFGGEDCVTQEELCNNRITNCNDYYELECNDDVCDLGNCELQGGSCIEIINIECGDGIIDTGENCDDNNLNNGDGCSDICQVESGWSCSEEPSVCVENCIPETCTSLGQECGTWIDGCGGTLNCGTCSGGNVCVDGSCEVVLGNYTTQLSQFGITWTFSEPVQYGQFANGDYWVVPDTPKGNVTIVGIDPLSNKVDGRIINGSMVNPNPGYKAPQGWDSSIQCYDEMLNVARPNGQPVSESNPLIIQPGSSLVSAISSEDPSLKTAAVLTVSDIPAPEGSFRPHYAGTDKAIRFNKNQLDYSLLSNLPVPPEVEAIFPSWHFPYDDIYAYLNGVETYFERPWVDHQEGWSGQFIMPEKNMKHYGRDISKQVSQGALLLNLVFTNEQKEELLINMVQVGIDLYGLVQNGLRWPPDGGHASGRKWPILFAGIMLNDTGMKDIGQRSGDHLYDDGHGPGNPPSDYVYFGEDAQTFYITQEDVDRERVEGKTPYQKGDIGIPEWSIRHASLPSHDSRDWGANYRGMHNVLTWGGFLLAAHIMEEKAQAKTLWNNDALFDYIDRDRDIRGIDSKLFTPVMWSIYRNDYGCVWTRDNRTKILSQGYYDCDGQNVMCEWQNSACTDCVLATSCLDYPNQRALDYDPCNLRCEGEYGASSSSTFTGMWSWTKGLLTTKTGNAILTGKTITGDTIKRNLITGNVVNETKKDFKFSYVILSVLALLILIIGIMILKIKKN